MTNKEILTWAQLQDVAALREFLFSEPHMPLIAIGSGGASSVCEYASLLYSSALGLSRAYTPLSAFSIGECVLNTSNVLLISHSGHNQDIVNIGKRCANLNPQHTANLTTQDSDVNRLKKFISPSNSFNYSSGIKDGFISAGSTVAAMSLLCRAFKPDSDLSRINSDTIQVDTDLSVLEHAIVLHGSWGLPIAVDLECKLVESGMMTCSLSDYRNYCHGRFIFSGNNTNTAIIMMVTPREEALAQRIEEIIPDSVPIVRLSTEKDSAEATVDLLLQASSLVEIVGQQKNINPNNPPNRSKIDKRKPQQIPYISTLKQFKDLKF